jgi:hypothetical protein
MPEPGPLVRAPLVFGGIRLLEGLFPRAVQHENDYLDGVLSIDRLFSSGLLSVKQTLSDLELKFQGDRHRAIILPDQQIAGRLAELEQFSLVRTFAPRTCRVRGKRARRDT